MKDDFTAPLELGTDATLANELGISRATVWRYVKQGIIPKPIKLSAGATRFDLRASRQAISTRAQQQEVTA